MPSLLYMNVGPANAMIKRVEKDSALRVQPMAMQEEKIISLTRR